MRPLIVSINAWVFEGIWTNVLATTVRNDSRFSLRRDRTYWTQTYDKGSTISPLFIGKNCCKIFAEIFTYFLENIDQIILIGKSLNLLRLLSCTHFIFSLDFSPLSITLRDSTSELIQYEHEANAIQTEADIKQENSYYAIL